MKNNGSFLGLLSGFFWGADTVVLGAALLLPAMLGMGNNATISATFIHDSSSFIILLFLILLKNDLTNFCKTLLSKNGLVIVIAALLGGPIGMGGYIFAIKYLGASLASSGSAIYPAIGALLAFIFLKEKMKVHSIVGLGLAIFAIAIMGLTTKIEVSNMYFGLVGLFVCIFGWGSEAVIINVALKEEVSTEIALAIRQLTSSIVYGLFVLPFIGLGFLSNIFSNINIISIIVLSGLLGTISYLCYYKSIDLIGATQAMGLNISYPAWAFILQFIKTRIFSLSQFILVFCIIIGSIMSNEKPKEFLKIFKLKKEYKNSN